MRIIGIDPGTGILGFGVVDIAGNKTKLVTAGVITTPAHTPIDERLEEIFDGLTEIIKETKPDCMSIEKLFFSQNVTTAISVAQARGVAMLTGSIIAPGVVRQSGTHHGIILGELDGTGSDRVKAIQTVCREAGIDAVVSNEINKDRWQKFVGLVGGGAICALTRSSIGPIRKDPDIAVLIEELMQEAFTTAVALASA